MKKQLTTVTALSKTLATVLFVTMPFFGFLMGIKYQKAITPTFDPDYTYLSAARTRTAKQENTFSVLGIKMELPNSWKVESSNRNGTVVLTETQKDTSKILLSIKQPTTNEIKKISPKDIFINTPFGKVAHNNCTDPTECHIAIIDNNVYLMKWNMVANKNKTNVNLSFSEEMKNTLWQIAQSVQLAK